MSPYSPAPDSADRHQPPELITPGSRAAISRLELLVTRRLQGMLLGDHRGLVPGPGTEPGEAREYQPGDDVRTMDWSVTARTTTPHIRQQVADRELETWILLDLSPSLDVESAHGSKRQLALAAIATVGFLASGDGSRIGLVLAGGGKPRILPAATGSDHVRRLLEIVATTPASTAGGSSSLAEALAATRSVARKKGLVVMVSDFLGDLSWDRALRTMSTRHETLAVYVADPLDIALPVVGSALLQDPASGEILELDVNEAFAEEYRQESARHRASVRAALRRTGTAVLALRTDRDWVRDVVGFVDLRRRGAIPTGASLDHSGVPTGGEVDR